MLNYKGYLGNVEFDDENGIFWFFRNSGGCHPLVGSILKHSIMAASGWVPAYAGMIKFYSYHRNSGRAEVINTKYIITSQADAVHGLKQAFTESI